MTQAPGAGFAVGVESGLPVRGREGGELVDQVLGQPEPDRVGQPLGDQPVEEFVGGARAVDADQHLPPGPAAGLVTGELAQRGTDDGDVVSGGVRARVAGPQQLREWLPGATRAVVGEGPQRMMTEPALERRRRALLLRVGGDQGRVGVDDQRVGPVGAVVGSMFAGQFPRPGPCCGAGGIDRRQRGGGVGGEAVDRPRHRRVRRDPPEQRRFSAQHGDVGQTVPTRGESEGEVEQHLRRIVHRQPGPPRLQHRRERPVQADLPDRLGQ